MNKGSDAAKGQRLKQESAIMESRGRIERFLAARMANPDDAQDLAQETFLRLLRVRNADLIEQPESYLFRIAINLTYEFAMKEKKRRARDELLGSDAVSNSGGDPDGIEDLAYQQERVKRMEGWLDELPHKARVAVVLQRRDGMTYAEIAERLGVSTHMVKKYLKRAISHCRTRMSELDRR